MTIHPRPCKEKCYDKLHFMIKHKTTNYFNLTVIFYKLGRKDPRKPENTTLNILHIVINLFSSVSIFLSDMGKTCFCSLLQVGKSYFRCHIFCANQKQQRSQEVFYCWFYNEKQEGTKRFGTMAHSNSQRFGTNCRWRSNIFLQGNSEGFNTGDRYTWDIINWRSNRVNLNLYI